jgi:hypothetical protein
VRPTAADSSHAPPSAEFIDPGDTSGHKPGHRTRSTIEESVPLRPLVIGCGALARELVALTRRAGFPKVDLVCLPATLHNRPEQIPAAVRARIHRARAAGRDQIFVAYADCGTGGMLDRVLEKEGVDRLEGAHCYEVYAGRAAFAELADREPGTFYLTDFLARNFDRLVIRGLGLDRHPELLATYFGNYTRVLYLAQTDDADLTARARRGARRLGLRFERRFTGYGELATAIATTAIATTVAISSTLCGPDDAQSQSPAERRAPDTSSRSSMTPSQQTTPTRAPHATSRSAPTPRVGQEREIVTPGHPRPRPQRSSVGAAATSSVGAAATSSVGAAATTNVASGAA